MKFVAHLQRITRGRNGTGGRLLNKRVEIVASCLSDAYFVKIPDLYPGWDISMFWSVWP